MFVFPFVHMEQLGSHCTDIHDIWNQEYFSKIFRESSNFIKIGLEQPVVYMKTNTHFYHISLSSS